jgi:asparagine synthase (glutamine-hydrolysing)
MRFSVEGRVPFLDAGLVRAVFAMPDDAVIKNGWNKRVLRVAVQDILPASITWRRNKIGFTSPQNEWFHELREFIYQVFLSESFASRPYFNRSEVLTAFELWLSGGGSLDSMAFWRILNVELWLREFFDPKPSVDDGGAAHEATTSDEELTATPARADLSDSAANPGKALDLVLPDGSRVRRHPVRTPHVTDQDDLSSLVVGHTRSHLDALGDGRHVADSEFGSWYLFVSEKVVAITQHRSFYLWDIEVTRPARLLSRYVTRTPAGIGLGSPFTMQLAIDEVGLPRVLLAAGAGALGRVVGRQGLFYTVVGGDVRAIDGPTEYSVPPANMSAKLAPKDPAAVAATISEAMREALPERLAATFGGTVVVDANDLGCNVLGTDVAAPVARLEQMFADNPLGQGAQRTPLALVLDGLRPLGPDGVTAAHPGPPARSISAPKSPESPESPESPGSPGDASTDRTVGRSV